MRIRNVLCRAFACLLAAVALFGMMGSSRAPADTRIQIDVRQAHVAWGGLTAIHTANFETAQSEAEFAQLAPTTGMPFEELVGDNGDYKDPVAYPAPDTFYVVVDLTHQVVLVYKEDANGQYTLPVRYMVCSTGAKKTPTPKGTFQTGKHKVRYGLFVNDGVYGQYWTNVTRRIYFHSVLYTKRSASAYTTSSYKKLGSRASHGCIRLLVPDARFLYYHLAPGSTVEIRSGSKEDLATAAIKEQLTRPKLPGKRPSELKGKISSTDNWSIDTYLNDYVNIVSAK